MEKSIFLISLRDFFTPKMLKYAVSPFVVSMIIMYIVFFYFAGSMLGNIHNASLHIMQSQETVTNGIEHSSTIVTTYAGSGIMTFLMSHFLTAWIFSIFFYIIGGMIVLVISIIIAIIVISFLTPLILRDLQQKHYPDVQMRGEDTILSALWHIVTSFILSLLMFILFIPFYFIPLLNIIMLNLPMYYLFHSILTYDVSSNIVTPNENKQILYFSGNKIKMRTLLLYIISLIPFAILFAGVFYVIFLGHTYFIEAKQLRNKINN